MLRLFSICLLAAFAAPLCAAQEGVLRLCADPDNPPFSMEKGADHGAYIEIAEIIAAKMGVRTQYTWWLTYYGKRAVRNTLLAETCDAYIGLPNDRAYFGKVVALTRPFLKVGYAVMLSKDAPFRGLGDLQGKRIAVAFNSPPQIIVANRPELRAVTFQSAEQAIEALARGDADAAFVWGPIAGHYNRTRYAGAWRVIPIAGEGLQWEVTIGVRPGDEALRARIDEAIGALEPEIRGVAAKYGFPLDAPVKIAAARPRERSGGFMRVAHGARFDLAQAATPAATTSTAGASNPFIGNEEAIAYGKSHFNQHCSHCHAPNAQSFEPTRDLRRLKIRYGENMRDVAYITVTGGRSDKGMPSWKGILDDETILKILAFLETVQRQP